MFEDTKYIQRSHQTKSEKMKGMKRIRGLLSTNKKNKILHEARYTGRANSLYTVDTSRDDDEYQPNPPHAATMMYRRSAAPSSPSSCSWNTFRERQVDHNASLCGPTIQINLFVMDPDTCSFELLQLQFDSSAGTKVADILPIASSSRSSNRNVLRGKGPSYRAIITLNGEELKSDASLVDYVDAGTSVVIAIPEGINASFETCAEVIKPILTIPKVQQMVGRTPR